MAAKLNPTSRNEIRNLLAVILSGVLCAFILAGAMLYYYGPTGRYYARNVLLSPLLTTQISFQDANPKTGEITRFVFDGIEISFYDKVQKAWKHVAVSPEAYNRFYDAVSQDVSLDKVTSDIQDLFLKGNPSKLTLRVRTESRAESHAATKIFQEVLFANEGNYYRVELREQGPGRGEWAYFYHPGIYMETMKLLTAL